MGGLSTNSPEVESKYEAVKEAFTNVDVATFGEGAYFPGRYAILDIWGNFRYKIAVNYHRRHRFHFNLNKCRGRLLQFSD